MKDVPHTEKKEIVQVPNCLDIRLVFSVNTMTKGDMTQKQSGNFLIWTKITLGFMLLLSYTLVTTMSLEDCMAIQASTCLGIHGTYEAD